jgi:hypothetical protein
MPGSERRRLEQHAIYRSLERIEQQHASKDRARIRVHDATYCRWIENLHAKYK